MNEMTKNNISLVEYCKAQLGRPYWYGTFGQKASQSLYANRKSAYPKNYLAKDYQKQIAAGQKVHDCIGLIKGYMWCSGPDDNKPVYRANGFGDISADMCLANEKRKGEISTIPEVPGIAVFMKGHVGVYIGDGWVIEARGHAYGVVKTRLSSRPWKNWAYIDEIQYLK